VNLPILENVDTYSYFREEVGRILLGLLEPVAKPVQDPLPEDISNKLEEILIKADIELG
jgi:hypothetical protein